MPPNLIMHSEDTPYREKPQLPIEAPLPILNAEDMGVPTRATPQSSLSDLGQVYDYAVQAPIRAGVAEYAKSAKAGSMIPELRGLWGAAKQYFKKPEETPTWTEIGGIAGLSPLSFKDAAMQAGLPYDMYPDISAADIGGFVGENAIDPLNLFGAGAAKGVGMGLMAGKGAKGFKSAKGKMSGIWDKGQRFEISDSMMKLKGDRRVGGEYKLSDILDHKELYKNYPELKKMKVDFSGDNMGGSFSPIDNSISLGGNNVYNSKATKETLTHEIQHYIQNKEGFAQGGNAGVYTNDSQNFIDNIIGDENSDLVERLDDNFFDIEEMQKAKQAIEGGSTGDLGHFASKFAKDYKKNPTKFNKELTKRQRALNKDIKGNFTPEQHTEYMRLRKLDELGPFEKYQRLAGEAEARDASARMNLTPEQRLSQQPLESTGLSLSDLIVRGESKGPQMSVGDDKFYDLAKTFDNQKDFMNATRISPAERRASIKEWKKSNNYNVEDAGIERGQGIHSPDGPNDGSPLYDLTENGVYPDDVYSSEGLRYYGTGADDMDREAYHIIRNTEGKPNAFIKIYRAVDKDGGTKIGAGDWVTTVRKYAKEHGDSNIPDGYKIKSKTVRARDIFTSGDSWMEFGYHPQESMPQSAFSNALKMRGIWNSVKGLE